jgi:hypothetical protein
LLITLVRFHKSCGTFEKNKKKCPLLSMMFINKFKGSYGTFGKEKKFVATPLWPSVGVKPNTWKS